MDDKTNVTDQILDLLLDALAERQRARTAAGEEQVAEKAHDVDDVDQGVVAGEKILPVGRKASMSMPDISLSAEFVPGRRPLDELIAVARGEEAGNDLAELDGWDEAEAEPLPEPVPMMGLGRLLGRLALLIVLLIVVVNIPFNRFGTSLARAMPDEASLIIRDGLVLKGSGERIYVLEENKLRWISSLDAFNYFGYRWGQVRQVSDDFLADFEEGRPIHLLLKCETSPHIYALEDGRKRWIKDIPTFEAEGYVWEDVTFVSCQELRNRPDGTPIPPDAGSPPRP